MITTQKTTLCPECRRPIAEPTCGFCAFVNNPRKMEAVGNFIDALDRKVAEMREAGELPCEPLTYDEFCAEYGSPDERRASLVAQFPQYAPEDEEDAWTRMDAENEAGARGQVAKGRY